jgi:hypothetical protein
MRENLFTNQFPHIAQACERLPPNISLMGKSLPWIKAGVSFNPLAGGGETKKRKKEFLQSVGQI